MTKKIHNDKYWDWEYSVFYDVSEEDKAMYARIAELAKKYEFVVLTPSTDEVLPFGDVFNCENIEKALAIPTKPRPSQGDFTVDFNSFDGLGPIRKNGQIWDFLADGPVFDHAPQIGDDFYDAMIMCFQATLCQAH